LLYVIRRVNKSRFRLLAEGDGFRHGTMLLPGFLLELTAASWLLKTMKAFFFFLWLEAGDGVVGSGLPLLLLALPR